MFTSLSPSPFVSWPCQLSILRWLLPLLYFKWELLSVHPGRVDQQGPTAGPWSHCQHLMLLSQSSVVCDLCYLQRKFQAVWELPYRDIWGVQSPAPLCPPGRSSALLSSAQSPTHITVRLVFTQLCILRAGGMWTKRTLLLLPKTFPDREWHTEEMPETLRRTLLPAQEQRKWPLWCDTQSLCLQRLPCRVTGLCLAQLAGLRHGCSLVLTTGGGGSGSKGAHFSSARGLLILW